MGWFDKISKAVVVEKRESWFEEILKFNPYHDEKGRFGDSGGAHSVTTRNGGGFSTFNAMEAHGHSVGALLTPHDTPQIAMARAMCAHNTSITPSTDLIKSPERDAIRAAAGQKVYDEAVAKLERNGSKLVQGKEAWVVIGPPASGKSALAEPISFRNGALEIDSDEAKKGLPEYDNGRGAGIVHEESSKIVDQVRLDAMKNGDNMVLPVVGKSMESIDKIAADLEANGYKAHLVLMDVTKDNATTRAISRWKSTGRFVDTNYVYNSVGEKPQANYESIKSSGGKGWDSMSRYDNNGSKNVGPVLKEGIDHAGLGSKD